MDRTDDMRDPVREDATVETAVLRQVLALHPIQITFDELLREVASQPEDFSERDAIERAVRELTAAGLVHRNDNFVLPSRAALYFDRLFGN